MPFVAWPPSEPVLQRQAVMRWIDPLTQAIIREQSRSHVQDYPHREHAPHRPLTTYRLNILATSAR